MNENSSFVVIIQMPLPYASSTIIKRMLDTVMVSIMIVSSLSCDVSYGAVSI
jgi:hypothetical protein